MLHFAAILVFLFFRSHPLQASLRYVALGDSITAGSNVVAWSYDTEWNWATGKYLQSFVKVLRRRQTVEAHNLAVPGALTRDLQKQVVKAQLLAPNIVTLLIGANDVCTGRTADVVPAITKAIDSFPSTTKVLLGTVSNVPQVFELQKGRPHCRAVWSLTGFCPRVLPLRATTASRAAVAEELQRLNMALLGLEVGRPNVKVASLLGKIPRKMLSNVDCFHPSIAGQARIAAKFTKALE